MRCDAIPESCLEEVIIVPVHVQQCPLGGSSTISANERSYHLSRIVCSHREGKLAVAWEDVGSPLSPERGSLEDAPEDEDKDDLSELDLHSRCFYYMKYKGNQITAHRWGLLRWLRSRGRGSVSLPSPEQ